MLLRALARDACLTYFPPQVRTIYVYVRVHNTRVCVRSHATRERAGAGTPSTGIGTNLPRPNL